jgi:transcriptional regulator with PAS, ATPase and Fis domain
MLAGKTRREAHESRTLSEVLIRHEGDLAAVALELGVLRVTLWQKRKKYNL